MDKPVLDYVLENYNNGKLPESFSLSSYQNADLLLFFDGAMDGIQYFHSHNIRDEEIYNFVIKQLYMESRDDVHRSLEAIENFFMTYSGSIINTIDDIKRYIFDNIEKLNEQRILELGSELITESYQLNSVKLGIMLVGLYHLENLEELVENMKVLALCDEFTVYVNTYIFDVFDNANELRFEYAQKVKGWGRIYLVISLENTSEEINKWLLSEGTNNMISAGYVAASIIDKINIDDLFSKKLDSKEIEGLCNIIDGLLFDSPIVEIDGIKQENSLLKGFISIAPQARNHTHYYLSMFDLYMWLENSDENQLVIETRSSIGDFFNEKQSLEFISESLADADSFAFNNLMDIICFFDNYDYAPIVLKKFLDNPKAYYGAIPYLMSKNEYKDKVVEKLEEPQDFFDDSGVLDGEFDLSGFPVLLQTLNAYPFMACQYVAAGLRSKYIQTRISALKVVEKWLELEPERSIIEYPDDIYNALLWLRDNDDDEVILERVNNILQGSVMENVLAS